MIRRITLGLVAQTEKSAALIMPTVRVQDPTGPSKSLSTPGARAGIGHLSDTRATNPLPAFLQKPRSHKRRLP